MDIKKQSKSPTPTPSNTPVFGAPISTGQLSFSQSALQNNMSKKAAARIEEVPDIDDEDIPEAVDADTLRQLIESRFGHMSLSTLPLSLRRRVFGLKSLQATQAKLEAQFREELLALERKYLGIYAPLWARRSEIVSGAAEPSEEEAGYQSDDDEEEELDEETKKAMDAEEEDEDAAKGIPHFWLTVLKMCPVTADLVTENDEAALEHLTDVVLTYTDDNHGFNLEFKFSPNEFFDDASLTKTYLLENEASTHVQDLVYTSSTGSTIHWKKDKDLTVTIETKKQRQKGTNKTRIVKRSVPTESFFNFFSPPVIPEDEEDIDPELQQHQEQDFEIGEMFKNKLVPRAIDWFTGKALEYEGYADEDGFGDDMEDGDYEDEDEDEHDEDEEDEDEEHHGHSHAHGGHGHSHSHGGHGHSHSHGSKGAKGGDKPEECKQQ